MNNLKNVVNFSVRVIFAVARVFFTINFTKMI